MQYHLSLQIQPGPKVMKVQVGHTVELPCVPKGVPEPTVTWIKDLKEYQASPDGSLVLKTVTLEDEGTYMCTASNTAGRDEARIRVVIQGWLQNFFY
uniref:Ig-like domain-containing protein n=1 Tax=Oryzias latipes TaxID=8090 RepID=A0A3P9HHI1_ORYLA